MKTKMINGKRYEMNDMRKLVTVEKNNTYQKYGNESWYVAAHLNRDTDRIGVQYHVIIMAAEGMTPVVSVNINLVNEKKEFCKSIDAVRPIDQVTIRQDELFIEGDNFRLEGDEERVSCCYRSDECKIDLTSTATHPVLKYLGEGYGDFFGAPQYGYSFPAMKTTGTVMMEGIEYLVDGIAWYDRQWGHLPEYFNESIKSGATDKQDSLGRSTFYNPQLSNGVVMSLGEVYMDQEGIYTYNATILEPDGTIILIELDPPECSEYWTSKATGHRYPTKFRFQLHPVDADLTIEVPYKPQQIISEIGAMTKYEAAAKVYGTYKGEGVTGDSYVELLGDWF